MKKFIIVETTCPNLKAAKKLAEILLKQKLAGCIHLLPIESHYVWQKKLVKSKEFLLRVKTAKNLFGKVEKIIKSNHDYELPEIISFEITKASKAYLAWLDGLITTGK